MLKSSHIAKLFASLFLALFTQSALAGDFATREIIGFSKDGAKFAFEEYGVQDGSGFAYSNIYIINTKTDSWTSGSPWRVQIDDENIHLSTVRSKNRKNAFNAIKDITEKGFIAATNRYTEIPNDPTRLHAHPRSYIPSGSAPLTYKLINYPAKPNANCYGMEGIMGFSLTQIFSGEPQQPKEILHKDGANVPKSRGCPIDYSFADLVTYYPIVGRPVAAILLLKQSFGFEGPDGRYIAITAPIER